MLNIFFNIINMSISAGYIILAVVLMRFVLNKAPKWSVVALWGVAAVRLVCPFSFESALSLMPTSRMITPDIMTADIPSVNTGIDVFNNAINPALNESFAAAPGDSANPLQILMPVLAWVWIAGMVIMLIYAVASCIRVRRRVSSAVLLEGNIYQSKNVISPFIFGFFKPRIYLAPNMNDRDMSHVIAHEMAHISRKDYIWKPLGFALLTVHWFNPLVWLGYILLCRDIELACDEKAIKELDRNSKADYSQALLVCSVNRRIISACPLAFGEVGVKARVKYVLNYKKPAFWIVIAAVISCIALIVCFLTDPAREFYGVKSICAEMSDGNLVNLTIEYSSSDGSYSVQCIPQDEGEYSAEGIKEYDGRLGSHRILIEFENIQPTDELEASYPVGKVVEIESHPVRVRLKRVESQDDGFYVYCGFDKPIVAQSVKNKQLNELGSSINIPISIPDEPGNGAGSVWIAESVDVVFPESAKDHIFYDRRTIETYFVPMDNPWGGFYYHHVYMTCSECGEVVEALEDYLCTNNHSACEGGCLS